VLSIRPDSYTVIDHGEMGAIIEAVLDQPNVRWETAGSLSGGKAVWCLARLDEPMTLPGDTSPTVPYLGITNRHDGKASCAVRATAIRIVCANTFNAAEMEGDRTGTVYSFAHRKNWREHIEAAREAVTGVRKATSEYLELATELTGISITPGQRELFVREFIPAPPDGLMTDRVARNIEEARSALRAIFESETTVGLPDTSYKLIQAAGEYLDHVRRARSWETRLGRTLMRPEPLKTRALTLARDVATVDA
jgi:phage/plasmid-like protein (TIGR03299 family)